MTPTAADAGRTRVVPVLPGVGISPETRRLALTFLVWLVTFASIVSWRQGVIYDGEVDPTVVGKAAVAILAAVAALGLRLSAPVRRVPAALPTVLVIAIVAVSLLGSSTVGTLATNLVLVARIALLAATILLILSVTPSSVAVGTMLAAMSTIGLFAAVTFIVPNAGLDADGRLAGGIPPLAPNELATLVLPGAIGAGYLVARRGLPLLPAAALLIQAVVIYLTGSRTALGMLAIGIALVLIQVGTLTRGTVAVLLVALIAGYYAIGFTDVLPNLLLRGEGVERLLTLNSRLISWEAVFAQPKNTWTWWLGGGISVKTIAVYGQYWTYQVFDSSWVSSIAEDGVVGTAVLVLYVVVGFVGLMADVEPRAHL